MRIRILGREGRKEMGHLVVMRIIMLWLLHPFALIIMLINGIQLLI